MKKFFEKVPGAVLTCDVLISPPGHSLNLSDRRGYMRAKNDKAQPKDFGEAMTIFLNKGHDVDKAIRLAAEQYPRLYERYKNELLSEAGLE